jgi:DNA-binding CsgD family transcriptional regulator
MLEVRADLNGSWVEACDSMEVSLARVYQSLAAAERELRRLRGTYTTLREASRQTMRFCEARPELPRLTFQERRVALLAASGKSNREIGVALHVSLHTVKSQMKSILRKLELRSRTQIVLVSSGPPPYPPPQAGEGKAPLRSGFPPGGIPQPGGSVHRSASDWAEPDAALVSG